MAFARERAELIIADIRSESASSMAEEITATGGCALALSADVCDEDAVDGLISAGVAHFGRTDVLLNLAGTGSTRDRAVTELDLEEFW